MNKTEQQKYTDKPSIFKQGPRKRALHYASLGAAVYTPRLNSLKLTEGSGKEAGSLSATRVEAACPSDPWHTWNKNFWLCKGTGSSRPEAVPVIAAWHGPMQANSSAAKLQPLNFFSAYCNCPQVLLGLTQDFPCFLCCVVLCSFFRKLLGKQCTCPCEQSETVEKQ